MAAVKRVAGRWNPLAMDNAKYTALVLEAYEDEVAGVAYFEGLALAYPEKAVFLGNCAALERATAEQLSALIRKYRLTPRAQAALAQRGALEACGESGSDWSTWVEQALKSYPRYLAEFRALEAVGPAEDQSVLAALTAHEVRLVEWLRAELPT